MMIRIISLKDERIRYLEAHIDKIEKENNLLMKKIELRKWIPCSEEMPKVTSKGTNVLAYCEMGTMEILYWDGGNWCHPTGEYYDWKNWVNGYQNKVIAWMPLPEPYEVKR